MKNRTIQRVLTCRGSLESRFRMSTFGTRRVDRPMLCRGSRRRRLDYITLLDHILDTVQL